MTKLERLLAVAEEAKAIYEDAHLWAGHYEDIALAAYYDAEDAYSKYYDELEKSKG
tara:strand:- start:1285 stop:1452 length:168 start_codon:yes stop_codon:yes gene_type:complete